MNRMVLMRWWPAAVVGFALAGAGPLSADVITVPGTADLWLSGLANGTASPFAPGGTPPDTTANAAPTLVPILLQPGEALYFQATGTVSYGPTQPLFPPTGGPFFTHHFAGTEHGISDVGVPVSSLLGVFLGSGPPNQALQPPVLNFNTAGLGKLDPSETPITVPNGTAYTSLLPQLQQVFYIGSGFSINGPQQIIVPIGAKALYLGAADGWDWENNPGSFQVTYTEIAGVPEPGTLTLLTLGAIGLAGYGWRRRRRA
jgi:PEP-CTERM motif